MPVPYLRRILHTCEKKFSFCSITVWNMSTVIPILLFTSILVTRRMPQSSNCWYFAYWMAKNRYFAPYRNIYALHWKCFYLLELTQRPLPPCKVWGHQTTHAGCRCENMVQVYFCWQDAAKRQTAGIIFNWEAENHTCCTDSREIWQGRPAHWSAMPCRFSPELMHRGGYTSPRKSKISTFW